ncbi:MAG: right-handed parallel beta-helix repeat-containing protein [Thermoplasmatota archaeon]
MRSICFTAALLLSTLLVLGLNLSEDVNVLSEEPTIRGPVRSPEGYEFHDPIEIESNTDLISKASSEGWPGSGTETNPIIISGYAFEVSIYYPGIKIGYTDLHIMINGCYFWNRTYFTGAELYLFGSGIHIASSSNISIIDSVFTELERGIDCYGAKYVAVVNCIINDAGYGIKAEYSNHISISNNTMDGQQNYCISMNDVQNLSIKGNRMEPSSCCLALSSTYDCFIEDNELSNDIDTSLCSISGGSILVRNNTFTSGNNNGVYFSTIYGTIVIQSNRFIDFRGSALQWRLQSLIDLYCYNNTFINCSVSGGYLRNLEGQSHFPINNTVNGRPILLITDTEPLQNAPDACQICVSRAEDIVLENYDLRGGFEGLHAYSSPGLNLRNSTISNIEGVGAYIYDGIETVVENCSLSDIDGYGLQFYTYNKDSSIIISNTTIMDIETELYIQNTDGVMISNCTFRNSTFPVLLSSSDGCTIENCSMVSNGRGTLMMSNSENTRIMNNTLQGCGLRFEGGERTFKNQFIDASNTVNGKPIIYIVDFPGNPAPIEYEMGQLILVRTGNWVFRNISISKAGVPLVTYNAHHLSFENCSFNGSFHGISLQQSSANNFSNCTFFQNDIGIYLSKCVNGNIFFNCSISAGREDLSGPGYQKLEYHDIGIFTSGCSGTNIVNCGIWGCRFGAVLGENMGTIEGCDFFFNSDADLQDVGSNNPNITLRNNVFRSPHAGVWLQYETHMFDNKFENCALHIDSAVYHKPLKLEIPKSNTVNGLPILYLAETDLKTGAVEGDYGQIIFYKVYNAYLNDTHFRNYDTPLSLYYCNSIIITNSSFEGSFYYGIRNVFGRSVDILNCSFSSNTIGLVDRESDYGAISWNSFEKNGEGINIYNGECHTVNLNRFVDNSGYAVNSSWSYGCWIYHNLFSNNNLAGDFQVFENAGYFRNQYYHTMTSTGNYWSDWDTPDEDFNGIVDYSYSCEEEVIDPYPLTSLSYIPGNFEVEARAGDSFIRLEWTEPFFPLGDVPAAYAIHRGAEPGILSRIETQSGTERLYNDSGLENGIKYWYRIDAVYGDGSRMRGRLVNATPDGDDPWIRIIYPGMGEMVVDRYSEIVWEGGDGDTKVVKYEYGYDENEYWYDCGLRTSYEVRQIYGNWIGDGPHKIRVKAIDEAGRWNSTSVSFILDTNRPDLRLLEPRDMTRIRSETILFRWEGEDVGSGIRNYSVRIDRGPWIELELKNEYTAAGLENGDHSIEIRAYDNAGHFRIIQYVFKQDFLMPVINITYPANGSMISDQYPQVKWVLKDHIYVSTCMVSIDGGELIDAGLNRFYNCSFLEDGMHTISVQAVDQWGSTFKNSTRFTVDTVPPEVIYSYPNSLGAPIDTPVVIEFSEEMNRDTLEIDTGPYSGSISWFGNRAVLAFESRLPYGQNVAVQVMASDIAGNWMEPYSFDFTTEDVAWVTGIVMDEKGDLITGVEVRLTDGNNCITRSDGSFSIQTRSGSYEISAVKEGYEPYFKTIYLEPGEEEVVYISLISNNDGSGEREGPMKWSGLFIFLVVIAAMALLLLSAILLYNRFRYTDDWTEE